MIVNQLIFNPNDNLSTQHVRVLSPIGKEGAVQARSQGICTLERVWCGDFEGSHFPS